MYELVRQTNKIKEWGGGHCSFSLEAGVSEKSKSGFALFVSLYPQDMQEIYNDIIMYYLGLAYI